MKKIILSVFTLTSSVICLSQNDGSSTINLENPSLMNFGVAQYGEKAPASNVSNSQNKSASLWQDNFSTPSNWTLDNNGQSGLTYGWNINTTSESWYTSYDFPTGISSTSGGNFAEVQNGDYNASNQAINVTYNMTTSSPINVNSLTGGHNNVVLQFQQYGGLFNGSQKYQVSTDGTTWTTVGSNNARTRFIGNNPSALYANPEEVSINIAGAIASNPSTVWIRFSWTSNNPSSSTTNSWTTFGWYIDDVEIIEANQNDLTLISAGWTTNPNFYVNYPEWNQESYYMTPISQIRPMIFKGTYANTGILDMTNSNLTATVNSGLFSSNDSTLLQGDTLLSFSSTTFTPPSSLGTYTVNYSVSATETDEELSDNSFGPLTFEITDSTMARDNGEVLGVYYNSGKAFELGNFYRINSNASAQFIDVKVRSYSNPGTVIYGIIYENNIKIDSTFEHTLTATEIANESFISLPLRKKVGLVRYHTYTTVVRSNGDGGATNDLVVATSRPSDYYSTIYTNELGDVYTSARTPMVRLKIGEAAANDLSLNGFYNYTQSSDSLIQYFKTPVEQVQPWNFAAGFRNNGSQTQNATVSVDINGGLFSTSTVAQSIMADSLALPVTALNSFTPPATLASYNTTYTVSSGSVDNTPSNNTDTETYEITQDLYSRAYGPVLNFYGQQLGLNGVVSSGLLYEIVTPQPVLAIECDLDVKVVGTFVEPVIYKYDGSNWNVVHTGDGYNLTTQDSINQFVSLGFANTGQYILPVGTYLFSIKTPDVGVNVISMGQRIGGGGFKTAFSEINGVFEGSSNSAINLRMGSCQSVLASKPQPAINVQSLENYVCTGTCVNEVYLNIENANYIEIFNENQNLIGVDSVTSFSNLYTDTISGTFCLGETYAAVAKSRCYDGAPFVQVGDTLYFQIDTTNIDIVVNTVNETVCGASDGGATFTGNYLNGNAPNYTINWTGPISGTVSGVGSGTSIIESLGTNLTSGTYTAEFLNTSLGCDAVPFTFVVGNGDNVSFDENLTTTVNTSNCSSIDGAIDLIITNPSGNIIDVSWSGPVSSSVTNISPSTNSADYINLPNLSNGTYQIIASLNGNATCSSDTINVNVTTNNISQELCVVTVDELTSTYNIVVWEKPANLMAIDSFFVYKEITTNNYQKVGAKGVNELSELDDFSADPNTTSYKYKVTVLDSCGSEGDYSLFHKSIHLQYLGLGNFQWTGYEIENTANQVASYDFYRDDNGTSGFNLLQVIPGGNTTFTDVNYASFPNAVYRVDVNWISGLGCTSTKANINTSRSNKKEQIIENVPNPNPNPTSVVELLSNETSIYPVPAKEQIKIKIPTIVINSKIQIMNGIGQVVYSSLLTEETSIINISDFSNGIYILVIETMHGPITKKLIKE